MLLAPPFACREVNAATPSDAPNYFFEPWPASDGLELNAVTTIVQTRDGYLWLGTYNGLIRFDGIRFTVFSSSSTPGLFNNRITALFEDHLGVLWIGHETGDLTHYRDGKFQPVSLPFAWVGGPIQFINMDEQNEVWLASVRGGVFRFRDGHCCVAEEPTTGWSAAFARDTAGRLTITSNGKLGMLREGVFETLRVGDADPGTIAYGRVLPTRDGGWWVSRNNQLGKWRAGRWESELRREPWTNDFATALLELPSGALLAATFRSGLFLVQTNRSPRQYTRADGLGSDQQRCLFSDREGNIWIGNGSGLVAMRPQKIRMLGPPDNFEGHTVLSFCTRPDGSAWIGTQGAGLYHFTPENPNANWMALRVPEDFPGSFVWSVLETRRGELFVGTWGAGLQVKKQGAFASAGELGQITAGMMALYESKSGTVWIGTTVGLQKYEAGQLSWVAGKDQLSVPDVRAIAETPDGTLWIGLLGGGLASLKNGNLKQLRKSDGLSSDFVNCLYADADGSLWIGTADQGLLRLKDGQFATVGLDEGLTSSTVTHIVDDQAGNFWLGSYRGILRLNKAELNRCADGLITKVRCLGYGRAEGLTSQRCPGGFQPGAARLANGQLWFPTRKGIAVIDPTQVSNNSVPPLVTVEEFLVEGKPVENWLPRNSTHPAPAAAKMVLPPGRQRFEFRYAGLSFAAPDRVRFKYRLEGLKEKWVEASSKHTAEYTHLPPGNYQFQVIACNNDEVWSETGAAVDFELLPYFYQRWWFRAAAVVLGVGGVAVIVLSIMRRRVRRKLEHLERQRAIEKERSRIARDIHDDLGASLTRITMLTHSMNREQPDDSPGASAAAQVNSTARELMRAMDEIVWAVDPRHDTLDSLATYLGGFAQDFLEVAHIRCRLEVPMQLPQWAVTAELRHNVFLALKEALHNIVKHAQATEVEILLAINPAGFSLIISDNGNGFAVNDRKAEGAGGGPKIRQGGGNGLANMRKRLHELGGSCEWISTPGQGTRVVFTIRVRT